MLSPYALAAEDQAPVVIGGLGGSGTRLVTSLLQEEGVSFSGSLNESLDNLWFTLLFIRRSIFLKPYSELEQLAWLFTNAMRHGQAVPANLNALLDEAEAYDRGPALRRSVLRAARETLVNSRSPGVAAGAWGWKQPNSHVMIPQLNALYPAMKYIYVVRNGLDMAFSYNQNQLQYFWGDMMLDGDVSPSPRNALRYWVASYRRVQEQRSGLEGRMYILDFDDLCRDPIVQTQALNEFLGLDIGADDMRRAAKRVVTPTTSGRSRQRDYRQLEPGDLQFLEGLGYEVNG